MLDGKIGQWKLVHTRAQGYCKLVGVVREICEPIQLYDQKLLDSLAT